jgi:DNA-binding Xre family transcriptional regulator
MPLEVRSNLRQIMDERELSIRKLAEMSELKFETIRRLRNDETVQYHRESIGAICEALNVGIAEILELRERV